ncbi:MAG: YihY/virulence factor BrkB family protein [Weeksellaceae bacterium]|nr:YihY/virulence factor BrkB family protein [Weeksellaceae bacterium]
MGKVLFNAVQSFIDDKCMKLSAALAYYSIFSITPLLLIIIWVIGFLYGEHLENTNAEQEILSELGDILGTEVSLQLHSMMENLSISSQSYFGIIIGIGTLIFTSTTVFIEIQDSINRIWDIKPKPKKSWLKFILDRLTSFSMILGLGFLLITSLLLNSILLVLINYFNQIIPGISNQMLTNLNLILTFIVTTSIFGCIFKILPDARVPLKNAIIGAVFTTLLFMLGRYGISVYLQNTTSISIFGAASSLILLLMWIYYSAAILYFGAEFTKEYTKLFSGGIQPASYAVKVEYIEKIKEKPDENK